MKSIVCILAAVCSAYCFCEVTRETQWQDVPSDTLVGTVVDLGHGGGSMTTNIVSDISSTQITNSVLSGYLCTSNAAVALAGAAEDNAKAASVPLEGNCVKLGNLSLSGGFLELGHLGEGITPTGISDVEIAPCHEPNCGSVFFGYKGFKNKDKEGFNPGSTTEAEWEIATIGDIPDAYTKDEINGNTVTNGGAKSYADAAVLSASFITSNDTRIVGNLDVLTRSDCYVPSEMTSALTDYAPWRFDPDDETGYPSLYVTYGEDGPAAWYAAIYEKTGDNEWTFSGGAQFMEFPQKFTYVGKVWSKTATLAKVSDVTAATNNLANVAHSGSYNDLDDKPTIPAAQVNSDWNAASGVAQILNKPTSLKNPYSITFHGASSGTYDGSSSLTIGIPVPPAAQIQSDWTQTDTSAKDYIKNKPTIISLDTATNIAEAVVAPTANIVTNDTTYFAINSGVLELHSDDALVFQSAYELTNYTDTASISLYDGQMANQRLTSQNALNITLKYSANPQQAGDAMMRVVSTLAATATVVSVEGATSFHFAGAKDWNIFDAGSTNLLSFTKVAMENGDWEIWVGKAKSEL